MKLISIWLLLTLLSHSLISWAEPSEDADEAAEEEAPPTIAEATG